MGSKTEKKGITQLYKLSYLLSSLTISHVLCWWKVKSSLGFFDDSPCWTSWPPFLVTVILREIIIFKLFELIFVVFKHYWFSCCLHWKRR
ncbi:uncharacterized protein DS421_8g237910 [Arachis hypogaea]|nr:uncharacterized protein DS421_8g237910 [Arachis hypogaea]